MSNYKLQASDIAGFAANGLKAINVHTYAKHDIDFRSLDFLIATRGIKPLLFNPSVLTQTITFRGKQVCHLIELAKIESRTFENSDKYTYDIEAFVRPLSFNSRAQFVRYKQYHTNKLADDSDSSVFEIQVFSTNPLILIKKCIQKPKYVGDAWYNNAIMHSVKIIQYLNWALVDYMGLGERGLCEYVDLENNNVYAK